MITTRIIKGGNIKGNIENYFKNNIPVINGVEFTEDDIQADYVILYEDNMFKNNFVINHDPNRVWVINAEPDTDVFATTHNSWQNAGRVYGYSSKKNHKNYINSPQMINWYVNKSYDEIIAYSGKNKASGIGWVTSNKGFLPGHKKRMKFLKNIKSELGDDLHLAGSGFKYLKNKWDGIAPYKYNLAIDNWVSKYSIDEKVMDCWAGLSLPLYYGSPEIHKYFPEKSFERIDIEDKNVGEKISEIINGDLFEERLPYILEARDILLNKHNMFNRLANDIIEHNKKTPKSPPQKVILEHTQIKYPLMERIKTKINQFTGLLK